MTKVYTKEEIINIFHIIHGTEKYYYSEVNYINNKTKIKIFCNSCKEFFWQVPYSHQKGFGCKKCAIKERNKAQSFTTDIIIKQFQEVHGDDKYDYSKVFYKSIHLKVKIFCNTCNKYFYQSSANHKSGKGCPHCALKKRVKLRTLSLEDTIKSFHEAHGKSRYDYSKVKYKHSKSHVEIKCNVCGKTFFQSPGDHKQGKGCPYCKRDTIGDSKRKSQEEVVKNFRKVHGMRYIYDFVKYEKSCKDVLIICREHGVFKQTPNTHLNGSGCPVCASGGAFIPTIYGRRHKKAFLYVLKITSANETFYKIGITSKTVMKRHSGLCDKYKYSIIRNYPMTGYGARLAEIEILKNHKDYKYIPIIHFTGYTECLSVIDINQIDSTVSSYKYKNINTNKVLMVT